jgi:ferric-dicitrate binding protein FerR (iron transport regulator)
MEPDDRTRRLLEEIRDAQRQHLAEFRRVTQQSLDLQQRAVDRQQELSRLYRRILLFGGVLLVALMALLLYLLARWSHYLFR